MDKQIHIIAEAGTNHNGILAIARELVDVAIAAKADSVKFQLINPEGLYLPRFFRDGKYTENNVYALREQSKLSDEDYRDLFHYCHEKGIKLSASVFDEKGINLLAEFDAYYFKIASCDLNNSRLLKSAAEKEKKMIISTGMATLKEIEIAVNEINKTGNNDIVLMHCVSIYPCPLNLMNLSFIDVLKKAFDYPVGLSDHSESSLSAAIAVAKEVSWIEKHFTLNRKSQGFDHAYALEPNALTTFIKDVRNCEEACRVNEIKISSNEMEVKSRARRSLYAARDIQSGEILSENDILTVRPQGPYQPNDIANILGKEIKRFVHQFEPFSPKDFS